MNLEDVIQVGKAAGIDFGNFRYDNEVLVDRDAIVRFANVIVLATREECAKMCEIIEDHEVYFGKQYADMIRGGGLR